MTDAEYRRLGWKCRRGMRELDILLSDYLEREYPGLDSARQASFRALLEFPDPEIFAYLTEREIPEDAGLRQIVERVRGYRDS